MHIHSLLALTLAATTSALPSLPECLMNDESRSRACREVGPAQSKQEIVDGQKQQNRGGLQGQIEYVDQQIGKEIECPECGKNIVGDLAHNNIITGQGEQQLDMINGKTHEQWMNMGQKEQDSMPHGQKSNFKIGQNQKRNQHFGQLFAGQSNTHGSMNMDTGKTQQDELLAKGQGMTQELYNGRIQERDNTHNWGNQLYQGQNQEQQEQFMTGQGQNQQEQFNKGLFNKGLYNTGSNTNGIIQDFNKGGQNQQLYNGQQLYKTGQNGVLVTTTHNHQQEQFNKGQGTQQLYNGQQTHQQQQWNNGPNDILVTTHQFYQGQPINTQQLNKGQGIQQLYNGQGIQQLYNGQQMDNQLYKTWQNGILVTTPNHQQEQFNKGQQTQEQFNKGQQTQEQFKTNGIQARHEITQTGIAEQFDGQNKQHQQFDGQNKQGQEMFTGKTTEQEQFAGNAQSKQQEQFTGNAQSKQQEQIDGQKQGQQWTKDGKTQEQWSQNGKQQEQFDGQNAQGQQELLVFNPQQMMDFISSQAKQGQQWVREQVVRDGKKQVVWTCVDQ